jgi:hypothetical protein
MRMPAVRRPSPVMVVGSLALLMSMTGVTYAATGGTAA